MQPKSVSAVVLLIVSATLLACGGFGTKPASDTKPSGSNSAMSDESLKKSPKDSIAYQFELLKAGDVDKLKECFTERLRDRITAEAVEKGKAQASTYTLDDLVASVEMGDSDEGNKTAKIMMKNGRTLTTLVQTDEKWLADTIWFK